MIFTPKNSSVITGSTALEVLKKTPGVFVDGENNISIGGKNSVLVILNGKQTYMQKGELITLLKATPSSSVSSVEVMHNPSAQYDAEGSGGIININMNRKKPEGFFFSLNNGDVFILGKLRENTELSFSYTKNRFSLSGNYNHAFGYYNMDYGMHRIQEGKDYYSPTQDTDKRKTILQFPYLLFWLIRFTITFSMVSFSSVRLSAIIRVSATRVLSAMRLVPSSL